MSSKLGVARREQLLNIAVGFLRRQRNTEQQNTDHNILKNKDEKF